MAVFTDPFTGTDGDNLESRTGWTRADGTLGAAQVNASNQIKTTTSTNTGYTAPDAGSADHYAQAGIYANGNGFPVCIRVTNSNNFIGARRVTNWEFFKRVAGTFTSLGTSASAFTTGDTIRVEGSGTSVTVKLNGTAIIGPATVSDFSTIQTPGLVVREIEAALIDDWESDALAGAGGTTVASYFSLMGVG